MKKILSLSNRTGFLNSTLDLNRPERPWWPSIYREIQENTYAFPNISGNTYVTVLTMFQET